VGGGGGGGGKLGYVPEEKLAVLATDKKSYLPRKRKDCRPRKKKVQRMPLREAGEVKSNRQETDVCKQEISACGRGRRIHSRSRKWEHD